VTSPGGPLRFDGRVVVVTGAGRGLGRSHARLLASRGAAVVVNDLRGADGVVAEIERAGGTAVADDHDISRDADAAALTRRALDAFGRLDAVVNNAAISAGLPFADVTAEVFDRVLKVNAYGPFHVTRHAWPHLIASGAGRVVMTVSRAPVIGAPHLFPYAASKGAVLGMTRQLASEGVEHGIAVNAVSPSAFTEMSRQGKVAGLKRARMAEGLGIDPADDDGLVERSTGVVSAVVAWLCHPDCPANGEVFKAEAGDVNLITFVQTLGVRDPKLTPEAVRDRHGEITDVTDPAVLPPTWQPA
jgi:NAD(P)-dependent dehydrogenase (short-subunit alcohol dehydrogenase family)